MSKSSQGSPELSESSVQICRPGKLKARRISPTVAELTWEEPYAACSLCPDAQGYEISGVNITTVVIPRPPYELRGLRNDSDYMICVRAKAADGIISKPSYFPLDRSPGAPGDLQISERTDAGFMLSWSAPVGGEPAFHYLVSHQGEVITAVRGLTCQVNNPTSFTAYDFEVRACSARGNVSDPATLDVTPPNKPTGLVAMNVTPTSAALMWERPYDNVRVSKNEIWRDGHLIHTEDLSSSAQIDVHLATELEPGTDYVFEVSTQDEAGLRSEKSDPVKVRTSVMGPPRNFRATTVGRYSISIAWDLPESAVGLNGWECTVQRGSGTWKFTPFFMQMTLYSLTPNTTYTLTMRGQNASSIPGEPAVITVTTLN
ncbi:fibronectin type III domain-containing protein [Pseudomonas sp. Irchel s3b2]|uniref:fibronectin type III domain-containing protein n=1 Tax=Pseudomonas sp. Irchel s3b2 TaxID=2009073 RepID=UPI000BA4589F|nr:fibronectin type III domain-containing protein [Pseudomonas sp. Irchel s3b2]